MGFLTDLAKGAISSITGGIIDFGGQLLSSDKIDKKRMSDQYGYNQQLSEQAFDREYGAYKTRYTDTVKDLGEAGLNPILAINPGISVGSHANAKVMGVGLPSSPQAYATSSARNIQESSKLSEETTKTRVETKETWERAVNMRQRSLESIQKVIESRARTNKITTEERSIAQNLRNIEIEYWKRAYATFKMLQEAKHEMEKRELTQQKTAQLTTNVKLLKLQAKKLKTELVKLMQRSGFYKGPGGQALTAVELTLEAIGKTLGVIVPVGQFK